MASKGLSIRSFTASVRPARRRTSCLASSIPSVSQRVSRKMMSTEISIEEEAPTTPSPRWKQTPPSIKAPVRLRGSGKELDFKVNSDPEKLDRFYIRMLGEGGDTMLSEEVKWQAVTHKSFDQGRRGFNDRLAYGGKHLVSLQAYLLLIEDPASRSPQLPKDPYDRTPFQHPALEGLEALSSPAAETLMNKKRLAALARQYELESVVRWLPRLPADFTQSGIDVVLTQSMYAIIGAVALEKGGAVTNRIVRERILGPLGFHIAIQ